MIYNVPNADNEHISAIELNTYIMYNLNIFKKICQHREGDFMPGPEPQISELSRLRFEAALAAASNAETGGIGTMGEKGVHRTLKYYFEPHEDCHEVPIGGYVADAAGENGIFEIQTMGFYRMKDKLRAFLNAAQVTVVYPVISSKRIIKVDKTTGEVVSTRRSPVKRTEWQIFWELYSIRDLLCDPALHFCIVRLEADEYRNAAAVQRGRKRRKGGASDTERIPTALLGELWLRAPDDYRMFLPQGLSDEFTAKEFSTLAGIDTDTGRCALNVMCSIGICKKTGKSGNAFLFSVV